MVTQPLYELHQALQSDNEETWKGPALPINWPIATQQTPPLLYWLFYSGNLSSNNAIKQAIFITSAMYVAQLP